MAQATRYHVTGAGVSGAHVYKLPMAALDAPVGSQLRELEHSGGAAYSSVDEGAGITSSSRSSSALVRFLSHDAAKSHGVTIPTQGGPAALAPLD